ncbi:MAG: hypothetical protein D6705_02330 [Deltaproteobacteria bacterium]|nr:MAG: hypothetical protein D6705_02330 [Deltaproteobacteria bacterium]
MAAAVQMPPHLSHVPFDAEVFDALVGDFRSGRLDRLAAPLAAAPRPLAQPPEDLSAGADPGRVAELATEGARAMARGSLAVLVMNGGMATRFGGTAKGVFPIAEDTPDVSFLAVKIAQAKAAGGRAGPIPFVAMQSFATEAPTREHLAALGDPGVPIHTFLQSVLPRVTPDGIPLATEAGADAWPDTVLYAAPGHGDTLGRLRRSGVLAALRRAGVEHVLVSNVDNLGATPDPAVFGAHLAAVARGAEMTVEVVAREPGDAGGCVAVHPETNRPTIIEGFRLPAGTDLSVVPHFNTNTLWFRLDALDREIPLDWFAVRKTVDVAGEGARKVVQFEQLIGQAADHLAAAFVQVERDRRFLPVKTRQEWRARRPALLAAARAAGLDVPTA